MYVAVIGPLEVRSDDRAPAPVPGAQERLLLAALTADATHAVDAERLVQIVWDGRPPPDPHTALHALVVGLRAALEPGLPVNASGRYVLRRGTGYLLALPRGEIDALRFTALAERGCRRLADDDPAEAERLLAAALQLWRGEPYADWPRAAFAEEERRRLAAVRTEAEAALVEARSRIAVTGLTGVRPRALAVPAQVVRQVRVAPAILRREPSELVPEPRAPLLDHVPVEPARAPEPARTPDPRPVPATSSPGGPRRLLLVALLLVGTLVAAALAVRSQQSPAEGPPAAAETPDARDEAERLADLSVTEGPLDISLLLAVQAFRLAGTAETRNALRAVLIAHPRADRVGRIPGAPQAAMLSGAGPTLVVVNRLDVVAWRVEDGAQPVVLMSIPREWGFWSTAFPSPTDDAIVGAGDSDDVPWVRMISAEDGESRLLLVGDQAGGAPVGGAVAQDGRRIVLLLAEPVGRAPEVETRWQVIELDAADGSVRDTGIAGTVPFPMGTLAVDFAHDAGSLVLWDRTGDSATLVDVDAARQTPIRALPNRTGTEGFRALPGGAARLGMDGEITLIDGDGATLQVLREHDAPVLDAVVSPDGTWAASAGDGDGQLYRWEVDPATGRWSRPEALRGHTGAVLDVEADVTGERLVTVSLDQTAISWDMGIDAGSDGTALSLESSELLAAACAVVVRDFTPAEWEHYLPRLPFAPTCSDLR